MVELSHEAKVRLTTLMARFTGPTEAARIVSVEFDVIVDRRMAHRYDASKKGCVAGPRYRELFYQVRERWLNDLATVAIAHQGHRLRMLDRLANRLEEEGDYAGALRALEQAAKEVGGQYVISRGLTERRQPPPQRALSALHPVDEVRRALVDRLRSATSSMVDLHQPHREPIETIVPDCKPRKASDSRTA